MEFNMMNCRISQHMTDTKKEVEFFTKGSMRTLVVNSSNLQVSDINGVECRITEHLPDGKKKVEFMHDGMVHNLTVDSSNLNVPTGGEGEPDVHAVNPDPGSGPAVKPQPQLPAQPPLAPGVDFEASDTFKGAKPGAVFTTREQGTGYYRDAIEHLKACGGAAPPSGGQVRPAEAAPESEEAPRKKRKR